MSWRTTWAKRWRSCPRLEPLEGRSLPSTVTTLADSGPGSLRQALLDTPAGGTVTFAPGLTGTISLTSGTPLEIADSLTVAGPGASVLMVSGNHRTQVFRVDAGVTAVISGLTVSNGLAAGTTNPAGGGVSNAGSLTLSGVVVSGNQVSAGAFTGEGGGIWNAATGSLNVVHCTVANNSVAGSSASLGGGLANAGHVILTGSTVGQNTATGANGNGGGIYSSAGTLTLDDTMVTGNTASASGGGIYSVNDVLTLTGSTVVLNSGSLAYGGGLFTSGGTLTSSTVADNTQNGGYGGGIYTTGPLTLANSTLTFNLASSFGPFGGAGGGLYNVGPLLTVTNSTVAGNTAAGVPSDTGSGTGGGIWSPPGAELDLCDTIVAGNAASATGPDIWGAVNSTDHDLIGDGTGSSGVANGVNGDQVGAAARPINPLLGMLQDNGGPAPTRALLPGSPAIDAGTNAGAPATDERGFRRIVTNVIDIGAYEYQPPATTVTLTGSARAVPSGRPVTFTATAAAVAPGSNPVTGSVTFLDGTTPLGVVPLNGGQATVTVPLAAPGVHPITAVYGGFARGDFGFSAGTSPVFGQGVSARIFAIGGAPGRVQVRLDADGAVLADFAPYGPAYTGPVTVAVADVNGDGFPDLVTGAAVGNPDVRVYDGKAFLTGTFNPSLPDASLLAQWFPYALDFNVGANVAVGDVSGDGYADVVTGATVGNPDVRVFSGRDIATGTFNPYGASLLAQWFPYALDFNVGANVAVGDISGDGFADIVTGATAGNPDVRVYRGRDIATGTFNPYGVSQLAQWFPYALGFNVGANVAVGDVNGDGFADVITGPSGGNPAVNVYNGQAIARATFNPAAPDQSLLAQCFPFDLGVNNGATVAAADFENTGTADLLVGSTQEPATFRVLRGSAAGFDPPAVFEASPPGFQGGLFVGA